jgi:hypothetical protein
MFAMGADMTARTLYLPADTTINPAATVTFHALT